MGGGAGDPGAVAGEGRRGRGIILGPVWGPGRGGSQPERPTTGVESEAGCSVCLGRFKLAEVAQMLPLFKETVIKDRVDISLRSVTYFLLISCQRKSRGSP